MKYGQMSDYIHNIKLDIWLDQIYDYKRYSIWIYDTTFFFLKIELQ